MGDIDKIVQLLEDEAIEKKIAAAIVLGELKAKGASVVDALAGALDSGIPLLQSHALNALRNVGARKALPKIFPLLAASAEDVRRAAAHAVASVGKDVVPQIRERMSTAGAEERRALDAILAELGGKEAFSVLLAGLAASDPEAAKNAAIAMRNRIKEADGNERRSYLAEIERFLKGQKKGVGSPSAIAAALKILGYLEDDKAVPTLMQFATGVKEHPMVRQEAIIALRFTMGKKTNSKVVDALLEAAESPDRTLAHTALHTLGSLELHAGATKRLEKLVNHPDLDRARFVVEQLGRQGGADAAKLLVKVVCSVDRRRAELAATALTGKEDAVPLLAKALLDSEDVDRAWLISKVLKASAKKIASGVRRQLLDAAMEKIEGGTRGWEALLEVVREADSASVAVALRALTQKLRKKNDEKTGTVLRLLCRTEGATDDDRYLLASLDLSRGARDTRPAARAGDEALRQLGALLHRGYDLASALRKDRALGPEEIYYVGFHFAEEGHPLGKELLAEVVKKGGRGKVAKMAKNKLSITA
jgi:HEAT repeat protein